MHHWQMMEREKLYIQDQLRMEQICAKKSQMYLGMTRDPAIQGILQQGIERTQQHIQTLNHLLQDAGVPVAVQH